MSRSELAILLMVLASVAVLGCANRSSDPEANPTSRDTDKPAARLPALVAVTVTETGRC